MADKRVFGLDLVRFFAIVFVLMAHTLYMLSSKPIVFIVCAYTAVLGVELFFVLSGFLIGTILIKTHNKAPVTGFSSIKVFWVRRWFRTLPNYYFVIIIYWLVVLLAMGTFPISQLKFLSFFVFMQDLFTQEDNKFFGLAWSLSIEEWFYLLFPLILFAIQFVLKQKKGALLTVIAIFLILPLAGRIVLSYNPAIAWDAGFRKLTLIRLDSIGMGVLCAFVKYYHGSFWNGKKWLMAALSLALAIPVLITFYYRYILQHNLQTGQEYADPGFFSKTFMFTLLSLAVALALPLLHNIKVKSSNYIVRGITLISLISYSLYLLHPLVILLVTGVIKPGNNILKVTEIWGISIAVSYLQYQFFETKITGLRDKFGKKADAVTVGEQTAAVTEKN